MRLGFSYGLGSARRNFLPLAAAVLETRAKNLCSKMWFFSQQVICLHGAHSGSFRSQLLLSSFVLLFLFWPTTNIPDFPEAVELLLELVVVAQL